MNGMAALAIAGMVAACAPAHAWDDFGHMEVAALAWNRLTPSARAAATRLLKLNPMYHQWTSNVPADERDEIAFVRASTWADAIQRAGDYRPDGPANGFRPASGPQASQNIGYSDHLMHKYWHFINVPFSPDGTRLRDANAPNIETQIAAFRASLSDPSASDDVKSYDLTWLLHLVGDVHQPLHAMSRFTQTQPDGDAGGNQVKIDCGEGCDAATLHAFWDTVLGTDDDPQKAITAAKELPQADAQLASIADEKAWIGESIDAAKAYAYAAPVGMGPGPFTLSDSYKSEALAIAKERVALAGARLASLLNAALKQSPPTSGARSE